MTFDQLARFLAVAKYRNFTKAANALFITTPTLSKSISDLESELGVSLFNRRSDGATLTGQGEILHQSADRILEELAHITSNLQEYGANTALKLSISVDQMFPLTLCTMMNEFRENYPSVQYEILPMRMGYTLWDILEFKFDFGVTIMQEMLDFRNRENLCYLPLRTDPYLVINMSESHPLAHREHLTVRDVSGYPMLFVCENEGENTSTLQAQIIRKRMAVWFDASKISLCESQENMLARAHLEQALFPTSSNTIGFYGKHIVSVPLVNSEGELIRQPGDDYALVWAKGNPNPVVKIFSEHCITYFDRLEKRGTSPK